MKKKDLKLFYLLFSLSFLLTFFATYADWPNGMIISNHEKILLWFPRFGIIWIKIRTKLRGALLFLTLIGFLGYLWENRQFLLNSFHSKKDSIKSLILYFFYLVKVLFYNVGAVVSIIFIINLILYLNLEDNTGQNEYVQHLHNLVNKNAYYPKNSVVILDTGYVRENIIDNVVYTFFSNGEFGYYPRIENLHKPVSLKNIHVVKEDNDLPFRITYKLSKTPKKVIYCFGGSTTFGTLISDKHTWPAQLMSVYIKDGYEIGVKNYGNCGHNSTQATLEFLELLKLGHRPSLAIFMDGINTGPPFDGCEYSLGIAERFERRDNEFNLIETLRKTPLMKALNKQEKLDNTGLTKEEPMRLILAADSLYNYMYANRIVDNTKLRRLIGDMYGIPVISIIQPNIFYSYNTKFTNERFRKTIDPQIFKNYKIIYNQLKMSKTMIDYSELFNAYGKPAVIDILHYSPDFNYFLALNLKKDIQVDNLPDFKLLPNDKTIIPFEKDWKN